MANNPKHNHLIWIDLEMTGLNPDRDKIIEIATIVTDGDLNIIAEGPVFAIHQINEIMENMDDWCTKQHGGSGLTERVKYSTISEGFAEAETIAFLQHYVPAGKSPMCGNSICQDRRFLYKYMPQLEKYFHYRNLDVSTVKELAKRWSPAVTKGVKKESKHLALEDIRDSIQELRHYKELFFKLMPINES